MTSHIIHSSYMSETIAHNKEDCDMISSHEKMDYSKGVKYCVIRDNLSPREDPFHKYNYHCYLNNKEPYHMRYGYFPFPPNVPFSDDAHYMKSGINIWGDVFYNTQQKVIRMNLKEFYDFLSFTIFDGKERVTTQAKKDYLEKFKRKWRKPELLSLVEVGIKDDFIYKGLVLFGIIPEFFVKVY